MVDVCICILAGVVSIVGGAGVICEGGIETELEMGY